MSARTPSVIVVIIVIEDVFSSLGLPCTVSGDLRGWIRLWLSTLRRFQCLWIYVEGQLLHQEVCGRRQRAQEDEHCQEVHREALPQRLGSLFLNDLPQAGRESTSAVN